MQTRIHIVKSSLTSSLGKYMSTLEGTVRKQQEERTGNMFLFSIYAVFYKMVSVSVQTIA